MNKQKLLKNIGLEIKLQRMKRGISQKDLAEKLDVHNTYLSKLESGSTDFGIDTLHRIEKALGRSIWFTKAQGKQ